MAGRSNASRRARRKGLNGSSFEPRAGRGSRLRRAPQHVVDGLPAHPVPARHARDGNPGFDIVLHAQPRLACYHPIGPPILGVLEHPKATREAPRLPQLDSTKLDRSVNFQPGDSVHITTGRSSSTAQMLAKRRRPDALAPAPRRSTERCTPGWAREQCSYRCVKRSPESPWGAALRRSVDSSVANKFQWRTHAGAQSAFGTVTRFARLSPTPGRLRRRRIGRAGETLRSPTPRTQRGKAAGASGNLSQAFSPRNDLMMSAYSFGRATCGS